MKQLIGCMMVIMMGCGKQGVVLEMVPGTYVTTFEHEYAKVADTLVLRQMRGKMDKAFTVERKSAFQRVRNGKLLPMEYKAYRWTALYDEKEQALSVHQTGRLMFFDEEKETLRIGWTVYRKL